MSYFIEYIDYELDEDNFSHFNLTITPLTNEVIAAASFWDRQLWKNVSLPIKPTRKGKTCWNYDNQLSKRFLVTASKIKFMNFA